MTSDESTPMRATDGLGSGVSRRGVLRAAAGSAAALAVGGAATGTAAAQDYGGWFTADAEGGAVGNYDGTTVDETGSDEVTVTVGTEANGGSFGFGPAAVRVSPGTTVTFEWTSNTHNVVVHEQPDGADWSGDEEINNEGYTYSHTFETEGIYKYYCDPHLQMGMKGAIVVGGGDGGSGGGGGGQTVEAEYGDWFTADAEGGAVDNFDGSTVDETGSEEVSVEVGSEANGGAFGFGPAALRVSPGTTVNFEWLSNTHNVVVQDQPDGADWSGDEEVNNEGYSYSHTFETPGIYTYYCQPHLSMGMKGAIVVGAAPGSGGGSDGGGQRAVAGSEFWGTVFAGAVGLGMLAPIAASVVRGGDRDDGDDERA